MENSEPAKRIKIVSSDTGNGLSITANISGTASGNNFGCHTVTQNISTQHNYNIIEGETTSKAERKQMNEGICCDFKKDLLKELPKVYGGVKFPSKMCKIVPNQESNVNDTQESSDFHLKPYAKGIFKECLELEDILKQAKDSSSKTRNIACILGLAGIGKTTLTQLLCKNVVGENGFKMEYEYVFYILLRDVDYDKQNISLLDFLLPKFTFKRKYKEDGNIILEHISESEKVLIIMDGLDEADLKSPSETCSIIDFDRKTSAEKIIKNLLAGNLLPKATKFITSRPYGITDLHKQYRPSFMVNIIGLDEESQKEVCKENCDEKNHEEVFEYMKRYGELSAYCYVPINCKLITAFIHGLMINPATHPVGKYPNLVITLTLIFVASFFKSSEELTRGKPIETEELATWAWNAFCKKRLYLVKSDFGDVELCPKISSAFLIPSTKIRLFQIGKRSYFTHTILHEFFVALKLVCFMSVNEFEKNIKLLIDRRSYVVTKFVFGLCNERAEDVLQEVLPSTNQISKKREILKIYGKYSERFDRMALCEWLFELHDDDITTEIASSLLNFNLPFQDDISPGYDSSEIFYLSHMSPIRTDPTTGYRVTHNVSTKYLFPNNIASYHYVLRKRKVIETKPLKLRLSIGFHGNSLVPFFKQMKKTLNQCSHIKLTELFFTGWSIDDDQLNIVLQGIDIENIEELQISSNKLTSSGIKHLANSLRKVIKPLRHLLLKVKSVNDVDEGAIALAKHMSKIETLNLVFDNITSRGIKAISEKIRLSRVQINTLNLQVIDDEGLLDLSSCVHKIEKALLYRGGFTLKGIQSLGNALQKRSKSLPFLFLADNEIDDEELTSFSKGLVDSPTSTRSEFFVNKLNLERNSFTASGVKALSEAISSCSGRIEVLELSENKVGDEGFEYLANCVPNIESLVVSDCGISSKGVKAFVKALQKQKCSLKNLNLSFNLIDDGGVIEIRECKYVEKSLVHEQYSDWSTVT